MAHAYESEKSRRAEPGAAKRARATAYRLESLSKQIREYNERICQTPRGDLRGLQQLGVRAEFVPECPSEALLKRIPFPLLTRI